MALEWPFIWTAANLTIIESRSVRLMLGIVKSAELDLLRISLIVWTPSVLVLIHVMVSTVLAWLSLSDVILQITLCLNVV